MNNLLYNIHLLDRKVATPGNSPFCVTGLSRAAEAPCTTAEPRPTRCPAA